MKKEWIIRSYLPIVARFDYLCVFVVLDSVVEDYLLEEDHILAAHF